MCKIEDGFGKEIGPRSGGVVKEGSKSGTPPGPQDQQTLAPLAKETFKVCLILARQEGERQELWVALDGRRRVCKQVDGLSGPARHG